MHIATKERTITRIIFWHIQILISRNPLASMLRIHWFQPITQLYKRTKAWKASLWSIQPLRKIWKVWLLRHTLVINWNSGCVTWSWCTTMLHFQLLRTLRVTFQVENSVRSTPASTALTLVSHRSHNAHTTNCHLRGSGERNGEQR